MKSSFLKENFMKLQWFTRSSILILLALAACAPVMAKETMPEKPAEKMEKPTEVMMEKAADSTEKPVSEMQKPTNDMMEQQADTMMESPRWFNASLTNVSNGQTFKISDFNGKVVLVEALAQWCSNCKQQQKQILELRKKLGDNPDFVSIGLDIDPNENGVDLKKYIETNGFGWTYAVAPAEVSNELASLYGTQFLNPPSTPMLLIDRDGKVTVLPLGTIKSSSDLLQTIEPLLKAEM
jgi:thiol-disulfide isomerase/thioredoxin